MLRDYHNLLLNYTMLTILCSARLTQTFFNTSAQLSFVFFFFFCSSSWFLTLILTLQYLYDQIFTPNGPNIIKGKIEKNKIQRQFPDSLLKLFNLPFTHKTTIKIPTVQELFWKVCKDCEVTPSIEEATIELITRKKEIFSPLFVNFFAQFHLLLPQFHCLLSSYRNLKYFYPTCFLFWDWAFEYCMDSEDWWLSYWVSLYIAARFFCYHIFLCDIRVL